MEQEEQGRERGQERDHDQATAQDLGKGYYDRNYGNYELQASPAKLAFYLSLLRKWVPEHGKLFELGVGQGRFLQVAAPYYRVGGCDINSFGVESTAARVPAADLVQGSCEVLAERAPLDAVVAWDVLEHLPDLDAGLLAIRDSLAGAGKLLAVVPVYDGPLGWLVRLLDKDETHVSKEGRRWWREKLAEHGLEIVDSGGILRKLLANRHYLHLTSPQCLLGPAGVALYFVAQRKPS